ncbi:MAG TPA: sulfotransferase family 2 domain-containing protein [Chryseosolibacter sp.]
MKKIRQFLQLFVAIARSRKLRYTGVDFTARRAAVLTGLEQFIPAASRPPQRMHPVKTWILKSPHLKAIAGHALLLKSGRRRTTGHLSVPKLGLSYIRIPRAASTGTGHMMLTALYPDLCRQKLSTEEINFLIDANLKHRLEPGEKRNTFFTIVRNPFARIVSVYRAFFEMPSTRFLYEDYLFGIFRNGMSFKEFVNMLMKIPDALKDQHLQAQHTFVRSYVAAHIDVTILKLEDSDAVRAFLSPRNLFPEHINRTSTYDYRLYYDRETVSRVYNLYLEDIVAFGYIGVYHELKRSLKE